MVVLFGGAVLQGGGGETGLACHGPFLFKVVLLRWVWLKHGVLLVLFCVYGACWIRRSFSHEFLFSSPAHGHYA